MVEMASQSLETELHPALSPQLDADLEALGGMLGEMMGVAGIHGSESSNNVMFARFCLRTDSLIRCFSFETY